MMPVWILCGDIMKTLFSYWEKILLIVVVCLFVVVSYYVYGALRHARDHRERFLYKGDAYPLINPAITANIGKHYIINFKPLRYQIEQIINRYPQKTFVYFSYLNNGAWLGINEREEFTAASTIKVPVAMSLLKAVEDGRLDLESRYTLQQLDLDAGFGDLYKTGSDVDFSVNELVGIMLRQSDNTALNALVSVFERIGIVDPLEGVYGALGWEFTQVIPELGLPADYSTINLKTLSNLFVALYDAKYVNLAHSQYILQLLAESPFNDRIEAGVPDDIPVAHKIGTASADHTFSDCGIVYAPNRNYLLCLGSSGSSEATAARFMAEVSRAVYDYVINR
jgi:beta-lactamase class A